ncbi:triphosphoribosyl-dephospho-CoA synthase MdcB [Rhizobium sp. Root1220]|uniref:triphosphoribosyl-dephospho-CoA synthase MdcB n=1 Tax=Rhizobium sp. Root1220 TaxID=1736432 RepID=UPI0006FB0439|nr:triphosphoribosyl-dephospho-CoA synthase MdcB [Rhizobium sp. Root1220]KQV70175.1 triphosphoribosyl-dephospho-CoA synthase MdcB [Rhizobium sp. Root1220]
MTTILALAAQWARRSEVRAAPVRDFGIAASAAQSLLLELETWPKPGLVSHVDTGSHDDMDADTFRRSAAAIRPYFRALADAGAEGCGMGRLRVIGLEAEAAMFAATSGINTHRGAIFGLGLLCAAAGVRASGRADPALSLGEIVSQRWGNDILDGPVLLHSHGERARRRFGAGGARMEAALGFPSVYKTGLPALRRAADDVPGDAEAARVQACFALIAEVQDTNLLHRGGPHGLRFARRAAAKFLDEGGVGAPGWRERAGSVHRGFIDRRLSPGGSADILAMTLFVAAYERLSC